jgi:hypothetical protein
LGVRALGKRGRHFSIRLFYSERGNARRNSVPLRIGGFSCPRRGVTPLTYNRPLSFALGLLGHEKRLCI